MKIRIPLLATLICALSAHLFIATANIGDIAVYNNAGDSSLAPTHEDGLTPSVVNTFTNTVVEPVAEYELESSGDGVKLKNGGKHLVMYNVRFDRTNSEANRGEMLTHLTLENGSTTNALPYGRAQGFIRDQDNNFEAVISGGTIVDATADDILRLHSTRSDRNSTLDVVITPGHTAMQVVRLDDALDYLRISRAANAGTYDGTAWKDLTWDTTDEASDGAMSYTNGNDFITLNSNGYYMVFANTHVKRSDAREFDGNASATGRAGCTGRIVLNGTQIEGTVTTTYLRGNQNSEEADDGTLCAAAIIKATAGDILKVQHMEETGPAGYFVIGGKTGVTIVHLPEAADVISLSDADSSGYNDLNQTTLEPVKFRTQTETPAAVFSHSTSVDNSKITVNAVSRYLFLGGYFDDDDGNQRICPNPQWSINGATIPYGETSQYSRNDGVHNNGNWLGMISTLVSNDYVEMKSTLLGNTGAISGDSLGLQGLDLATITTNPVLIVSTMAITTNSTGTVKPRHLLTRDTDTAASAVTYTVTSVPANALVYNDGTLLTNNASFTQADIDTGKITLTSGGTLGAFDVFDFSVSDGGSNPSIGTFSILASAGVAVLADTGSVIEDFILSELTGGVDSVLTNDFGVALFVSTYDSTSTLGVPVTMNSDGTFTYDPTDVELMQSLAQGSSTNDTFTYTVEDFAGLSGVATVTITVIGTNDTFAANADYVNESSVTDTGAVSLVVNLVKNDGITGTENGNPASGTLMLNYVADYFGEAGRWYNTGYNTQSGMNWYMTAGCTPASITSTYAGLSRAFIFDGVTGWGSYNEGGFSIHDITTGDPDEFSATFELWVKPDPAALLQTNTLFETGGGTGIGIIIEKGVLKAAQGIFKGVVSYDLLDDPMDLLEDDITNEFFNVTLVTIDNGDNILYVNGTEVDSAYHGTGDWDGGDGSGLGHFGESNHGGFQNGASGTGYDTYYAGAMASFRIYSTVLTEWQIRQNYNAIKNGATDIDGDTITVNGIYNGSGALVTGLGNDITLASGATIKLDSATGSFTYDASTSEVIKKLWDGQVYIDTFTYQATDGNGATSDARVQVYVYGISEHVESTVEATEGTTTAVTAGELLRDAQQKSNGLNPYVALYAHPEQIEGYTTWINRGTAAEAFNASLDISGLTPVASGFGGIGYALSDKGAAIATDFTNAEANQTWEVWFKPDIMSTGKSVILEAGGNGNGTMIYYDANRNSVNVVVDGGDDSIQTLVAEIVGVSKDEFNQVVAVVDFETPGQPDVLTLYLNNDPATGFSTADSVVVSNLTGNITLMTGTDDLGIGRLAGTAALNAAGGDFAGDIAHVLIYDYALSQSQVQTAYNSMWTRITAVQGGTTPLGASVSLSSGVVTYDGAVTNDIAYGDTDSDSFTYTVTYGDGSTASYSAPVNVTGVGPIQAVNDTIVISANLAATNFNPLANDNGFTGSAVILTNSTLVADFVDDYQDGIFTNQPADFRDGSGYGWQYLWNAPTNWVFESSSYDGDSGAITDTSAYSNLLWAATGYWQADTNSVPSDGVPSSYVRMRLNGGLGDGHPGEGFNEGINNIDRCPILAYTVAEDGYYSIYDSLIYKPGASGTGLALYIMVDGSIISQAVIPNQAKVSFDTHLGYLSTGETVYVAVGGNGDNAGDTFDIDYSILKVAAPEAKVIDVTGSVINNGTSITYTTDDKFAALGQGQSSYQSFTYTVMDGGVLRTATITIEIQGVNDAPVAVDDDNNSTTDEDSTGSPGSSSVLDNDTDVDVGDIHTLFVSQVQGAAGNVGSATSTDKGATVTLYSGGWYSYNPGAVFQYLAAGESTTDTFTYKVKDQYGAESTSNATVTVTITGNDDGVSATPNAYSVDENKTVSGNLITDDTGDGVDSSTDTSDILAIHSVNTNGLMGILTIATPKPVCFRGETLISSSVKTVTYDAAGGTFTDPVVFAGPAGSNEADAGTVVVTNINPVAGTFDVVFIEAHLLDGTHSDENITWMVFEKGEYQLADGTRFEVGRTTLTAIQQDGGPSSWQTIDYSTPFSTQPVVINQLQSWNNPDGELYSVRMSGTDYFSGGVKTNSFQAALEDVEGDSIDSSTTASEELGWIAMEPGTGLWDGNLYEAVVTGNIANHTPTTVNLANTYTAAPMVIGSLAAIAGADPCNLRYNSKSATQISYVGSEDAYDGGHAAENVTYLATGGTTNILYAYDLGPAGAFTYDPAGQVNPQDGFSSEETFTYTLTDQHGVYTDTKTVTITVQSVVDGLLIILY